jgi:mono/diheme cytochrome c family protein
MSTSRLPLLALLPVLLLGCQRSWDQDSAELQAHYKYRHRGDCNAWADSPVTGHKYCASPPIGPDVPPMVMSAGPAFASVKDGPTDTEALRAHGEKVYTAVCAGCHGADGKGLGDTFPPLAGAGGYYGDGTNHARIIVHGLQGPIEVLGKAYNGAMPPQGGSLSDYDIAAVATYERTSWGNADGPVLPEVVASVR